MAELEHDSRYWDSTSKKIPLGQHYDPLIAENYRNAHLDLLNRWAGQKSYHHVLKTDLFAEAMCPARSFTWETLRSYGAMTGMDISVDICRKAKVMAREYVPDDPLEVTICDLRSLPFGPESFDLIISDSTLDHYNSKAEINAALKELVRVLKPGGAIIITMDNPQNFTEPFFRLWLALGLSSFYIGQTCSIKELEDLLHHLNLSVVDKTAIVHSPRFFAKFIVSFIRKFQAGQADTRIKRLLNYFDSWGHKRTQYLTAQFIAIKALKPLIK